MCAFILTIIDEHGVAYQRGGKSRSSLQMAAVRWAWARYPDLFSYRPGDISLTSQADLNDLYAGVFAWTLAGRVLCYIRVPDEVVEVGAG